MVRVSGIYMVPPVFQWLGKAILIFSNKALEMVQLQWYFSYALCHIAL